MQHYALGVLEIDAVLEQFPAHAGTSLGRARVREARPYGDAGEAHAAQRRSREALAHHKSGGRLPLHGISDVRPILAHLVSEGRPRDGLELVRLRQCLVGMEGLIEHLRERADALPSLLEVMWDVDPLPDLIERLDRTLDERGEILDRASPRLQTLREEMREVDTEIHRAIRHVLARAEVRRALQDEQVHWRDGRPVLAVKREQRGVVRGMVHDYSQSGVTAFVEPDEVLELGNRLSALQASERQEIHRILVELTRTVLRHRSTIDRGLQRTMEVELAWNAAHAVVEGGWTVPVMEGEAPYLDLRKARHPLLDRELQRRREAGADVEDLVPLDLHLGDAFDLLVVTGPNTGGKTVAMKATGVCAVLAASGLPIPADEGSRVPYYGSVFADIGDEQAIAQSLSTFSSHLRRIQDALAHARSDSLVLLDEVGAGTDPAEGAALGYALLETLLERRIQTVASTHLGALKLFAYRNARAENASVEFDAESLKPLYRLQIGLPGESNALRIARRLGLDSEVVSRAQARLQRVDSGLSELIEEVRQVRTDAERSRHRAKEMEAASEQRLGEVEERQRELAERGAALGAEADRVVEESFRMVRREVDALVGHLPTLPRGAREIVDEGLLRVLGALEATPLADRRREFIRSLKPGSWVYVPKYRQRCVVRRVDRKHERVRVQMGALDVEVGYADVTWFETL